MKIRKNKPNKFQDHVLSNNWKRASFVRIEEASVINFPQLNWGQLKMITLGSYQLKQANGYLVEHFTTSDDRYFEIAKEKFDDMNVIRSRLQSRHKAFTVYFIYVSYAPQKVEWY